jgi:hypothetical protein
MNRHTQAILNCTTDEERNDTIREAAVYLMQEMIDLLNSHVGDDAALKDIATLSLFLYVCHNHKESGTLENISEFMEDLSEDLGLKITVEELRHDLH